MSVVAGGRGGRVPAARVQPRQQARRRQKAAEVVRDLLAHEQRAAGLNLDVYGVRGDALAVRRGTAREDGHGGGQQQEGCKESGLLHPAILVARRAALAGSGTRLRGSTRCVAVVAF